MRGSGLLETMARTDLDALLDEIGRHYRTGAFEALEMEDPGWRGEVERKEAEVGQLYEALARADTLLVQWRQAMSELYRLWRRVEEVSPEMAVPIEDVA